LIDDSLTILVSQNDPEWFSKHNTEKPVAEALRQNSFPHTGFPDLKLSELQTFCQISH
jgi:hypothetical protein